MNKDTVKDRLPNRRVYVFLFIFKVLNPDITEVTGAAAVVPREILYHSCSKRVLSVFFAPHCVLGADGAGMRR